MIKGVIFRVEFTIDLDVLKQTWHYVNTKIRSQWKNRKSRYQLGQIVVIFSYLIALILAWNSVKGFRVTKIVKDIKLEGVWCELESKIGFQRQPVTKYLRLTLVFTWHSAFAGKV